MSYSSTNQIMDGQIVENDYTEQIITDQSNADAFVHNSLRYKLFYIFIIGSIFGCYMEQILYYLQKNIWECRAGVVWGPFSEIYGVGAVLVYMIYRKMRERSPLVIFLLSLCCGSMFEYIARLFQELTFHSVTWDYSKQPFNLGGRTSLKLAICWGLLGLLFVKAIFPVMDRQLDQIRGHAAYHFTWVLIIFMAVNMIFSSMAVHRWYERMEGLESSDRMEVFLDNYYNDEEMKQRFPHMKFIADDETGTQELANLSRGK